MVNANCSRAQHFGFETKEGHDDFIVDDLKLDAATSVPETTS
ncbi:MULTISPECIES: hypothetical protein [unclassified Rhizobium]|nr:hypothetical protein [Rhizobium sp. AN80A]